MNFDTINEIRLKVIKLSLLQYKKKYEWTKRGPNEFDCSGLTWFIYNTLFEVDINYLGIGQSTTTKQMTSEIGILKLIDEEENDYIKKNFIDELEIGDILFFHRQSLGINYPKEDNSYPGHCGIYLGGDNFIHCSKPKGEVIISNFIENDYWQKVLVGSKDIVKDINK